MAKAQALLNEQEFVAAKQRFAVAESARQKKAHVVERLTENVYQDPTTSQLYKRYAMPINNNTVGVTTYDSTPGEESVIWEYALTNGLELQFLGGDPMLYIEGVLKDANGNVSRYPVKIEVWDNSLTTYRGTLFEGESDDINNSSTYRTNGFPLTMGGGEVRAVTGDRIQMKIVTPAFLTTQFPVLKATSKLTIRGYQMIPIKHG